jgi:NAD(P)-dependent dehydrogenase (short-subunit alcohol dehydrogenase family)
VTAVQGDVSNLEDLDRLFAKVRSDHGRIDVLFANAGLGALEPLGKITVSSFDLERFPLDMGHCAYPACRK